MAVQLMLRHRTDSSTANMEETAVKEAASGLKSVEKLINLLSHSQTPGTGSSSDLEYTAVADAAVSKFQRVISLLDRQRTGHARFRRGPPVPENPIREEKIYYATPIQQFPPRRDYHAPSCTTTIDFSAYAPGQHGGEPEGKVPPLSAGFRITDLSRIPPAGKPPLSSSASFKRKCSSDNLGSCHGGANSSRCHCSSSKKSRKLKLRRVVRVPAISLKMADIPTDEFSWRKYGQKPIKGSPHPRGYYKCSSVRGCPARKHVERAVDDPAMLVVTYEGDHSHSIAVSDSVN